MYLRDYAKNLYTYFATMAQFRVPLYSKLCSYQSAKNIPLLFILSKLNIL